MCIFIHIVCIFIMPGFFFLTSNDYLTPQLPFSFWDRVLCILELRMTLDF